MKIILLSVVILFLSLAQNILAEKVITCKLDTVLDYTRCRFSGVTIRRNEAVSIKTDPEDLDVNSITCVDFAASSVYSVPSEIFKKFPNVEFFAVMGQDLQEIKPDAFRDGKKLTRFNLANNKLTFLHKDTFKGEFHIHITPIFLSTSFSTFPYYQVDIIIRFDTQRRRELGRAP
jgi:hypothetical protein